MNSKFHRYCITRFLVLMTAIVVFLPTTVLAQKDAARIQKKIAQADADLKTKTIELDDVRDSLEKISAFSEIGRSWFNKFSAKEAEIKALEAEKATKFYAKVQNVIIAKIKQCEREQNDIARLNGEVVIAYSNKPCKTLDQLRAEFSRTAEESMRLNKEYKTLTSDIQSLNADRDNLVAELESFGGGKEARRQGYQKSLETKKADYQFYHDLAFNPEIWWLPSVHGPLFLPRMMAIRLITDEYDKQVKLSGKKFSPDDLASKIKEAQRNALAIKEHVRSDTLPMLEKEIADLEKEIDSLKTLVAELIGSWMLTVGKSTSIIQVTRDSNDWYHGVLTKNNLRDYKDGQEIFAVQRTSPNTFEGTENAFTDDGRPITNSLKITVHSNENYLTYVSDSTIQMRRCHK